MPMTNIEIRELNTQIRQAIIPDTVIERIEALELEKLDGKGIETLSDIRRVGGIPSIEGLSSQEKAAVRKLEAHAYLELISDDLKVNEALIKAGFRNTADIARASREVFINGIKSVGIEENLASLIHDKARSAGAFFNNVTTGWRAAQANGFEIDDSINLSEIFPRLCECKDCESAVSPIAYLVDLLDFAAPRVRGYGGTTEPEFLEFLEENFHQPFGKLKLPSACEEVDRRIRQVRLCIEVLRRYTGDRIAGYDKTYLLEAYRTILIKIGASYDQIRLAKTDSPDRRIALSERLGIGLSKSRPDELDRLLIAPENITEKNLEKLFGLPNTEIDDTHLYAGSTPPGATEWQEYINNQGKLAGIYLDVDTSSTGFTETPIYLTSLGGDDEHWRTVGATSIYRATPTGFRVYLRFTGASQQVSPRFANQNRWHINWIAVKPGCNSGSTIPDETNWKQAEGDKTRIYVDVNTSSQGFEQTPNYFVSLGGNSSNWSAITTIEDSTENGFRVYVRFCSGQEITPEDANKWKWHIQWLGIESGTKSGSTPPEATDWEQDEGNRTRIYVDVDTNSGGFATMPVYLTSLNSNQGHEETTGITSICQPSFKGFRIYLRFPDDREISPDLAEQNQWHIQWTGMEYGTPAILKWRLGHLRAHWKKQDWPSDVYTEASWPVIDPDIIGPDDFRNPVRKSRQDVPDKVFDIWVKRREWVDSRIQKLAEEGYLLGAILGCMYDEINYDGKKYDQAWASTTLLKDLDAIHDNLIHGRDMEETKQRIQDDLKLTVESFTWLMEIRAKDMLSQSNPMNEAVAEEEWQELYSILVQAQKVALVDVWLQEERELVEQGGISLLDPRLFWISLWEPVEGQWPPVLTEGQPVIDPDFVELKDLAESMAGKQATQLWKARSSRLEELYAEFDELCDKRYFDGVIELSFGNPPSGQDWNDYLDSIYSNLNSGNRVDIAKAKNAIKNRLCMTVEDFERLMELKAKHEAQQPFIELTAEEWSVLCTILKKARKARTEYPNWLEEEKGLRYWDVLKARLPLWRASGEARAKWQSSLKTRSRAPIIDPDLVKIADIANEISGNVAYEYLLSRGKWVEEQLDEIRNYLLQKGDPIGSLINIILGITASDLRELADEHDQGGDITLRLDQLNLDMAALKYLLRAREIAKGGMELMGSEWEQVYSILVQVRKRRMYAEWRDEERGSDIIHSPDFFRITEIEYEKLPSWRANRETRWDWEDKLKSRIEQDNTAIAGMAEAVDACEEATLFLLRDALINTSDVEGVELADKAEWLTDRLLIDFRTAPCLKTTRVSQAITTLQNLLSSLRTGQWDTEETGLNLGLWEPWSYADEWRWMGSYATWKAAVAVFLYPENVLLPSFRRQQTPVFQTLIKALRGSQHLTPQAAQELTMNYEDYVNDMCQLYPVAMVQTFQENQDGPDIPLIYIIAKGWYTKSLYMSCYAPEDTSATALTFWEKITGIENLDSVSVVDATCYKTVTGRYIYLFLNIRNGSVEELCFTKYNLDTGYWDAEPDHQLKLPEGAKTFSAIVKQRTRESDQPHLAILCGDLYARKMDGEEWVAGDWEEDFKIGEVGAEPGLDGPLWLAAMAEYGDHPEYEEYIVVLRKNQGRIIYKQFGLELFLFSIGAEYETYLANKDNSLELQKVFRDNKHPISPSASIQVEVEGSKWRVDDSVNGIVYIIRKDGDELDVYGSKESRYWRINQKASSPKGWLFRPLPRKKLYFLWESQENTYYTEISDNIDHKFPDTDIRNAIAGYFYDNPQRIHVIYSCENPELEARDKICSTFEFPDTKSQTLEKTAWTLIVPRGYGPPKRHVIIDAYDLSMRPHNSEELFMLNSRDNVPSSLLEYIKETFYFIPVAVAIQLQRSGQYDAALDWFRAVYNYALPLEDRKIYYGLKFEEDFGPGYEKYADWVRDPLDVHLIASTRQNAYTRFTLIYIICCLLAYADAEFTRDTSESLVKARMLYDTAHELIKTPELEQKLTVCKDILRSLNMEFGNSNWTDEWKSIMNNASHIKSVNVLQRTADKLLSIMKGEETPDIRIAQAGNEVKRALMDQMPVTLGEIIARRRASSMKIARIALENESIEIGLKRMMLLVESISRRAAATENGGKDEYMSNARTAYSLTLSSIDDFCVPSNPIIRMLRIHAELSLHKLRTCRNIAGVKRVVDPYAAATDIMSSMPSISPGGQLIIPTRIIPPPVPYRYEFLMERARQLANMAAQVEGAFLSALEKRDKEMYDQLRARQDVGLARAGVRLQNLRFRQARDEVKLAELQRDRAQIQFDYYDNCLLNSISFLEWESVNAYLMAASIYVAAAAVSSFTPTSQAAGYAAQALTTGAQAMQMLASYERRREEWQFQKNLSENSILIGEQQKKIAEGGVDIVEQERNIAQIRVDHAEDIVEFLNNKLLNFELYDWMSDVLEGVYSYFLYQSTAMAKLAQSQLAFERQQIPPAFIQDDYWEVPSENPLGGIGEEAVDRHGLTGSARLLADIYRLDQYRLETEKRKLQLTKTISLALMAPFEFQRFRETGVMVFDTAMEIFDRDFPGHHLRLIKRVRTSVMALIPPTQGIKATLSNIGISRIVVNNDGLFQKITAHRPPESVALSSPNNATGLFEMESQSEMLLPFEGLGVDTTWELRMPKAANQFDYKTIADVLITIEYTALDSYDYRQQVIEMLRPTVSAERPFSMQHQFPDQWYDLHNPEQTKNPMKIVFRTCREDFPTNIESLKIQQVLLYFARRSDLSEEIKANLYFRPDREGGNMGGEAVSIDGLISTRRSNAGSWTLMIGHSPVGEWTLELPDSEIQFKNEEIEDILLVVTYSGNTSEWPK